MLFLQFKFISQFKLFLITDHHTLNNAVTINKYHINNYLFLISN